MLGWEEMQREPEERKEEERRGIEEEKLREVKEFLNEVMIEVQACRYPENG
jgi:hypothetical protein